MKGKYLTLVASVWVVFAAINHVFRYTYWNDLFMDQENLAIVGFGHLVSEILNTMDFALLLLAVGIALWLEERRVRKNALEIFDALKEI